MELELGVMRAVLVAAFLTLSVACGGGSADSSSGGGSDTTSSGAEEGGDPTEGGTRRAARDAQCDYGGSADRTCQRGLYCCYGPPDNPGDHGRCMPECPEY